MFLWYFGELIKLLLTVFSVMSFQVPVMTAGRRRLDSYTHMGFMYFDLGGYFVKQRHEFMAFYE